MEVRSIKKYNTYVDDSLYKKIKLQSLLKKTLLVMLLILVGNFFVAKIFNYNLLEDVGKRVLNLAGIYTEPIPQVSFESDGYKTNTPGSWHVDKSAKWTGFGKAKVTFDLNSIIKTGENYKDIIFVLDISGSMAGDKLERVKQDATELTEYVLTNPENKVALISFDSTSTILSYLTNDKKTILDQIGSLEDAGSTNYNAGLKNVEKVLEGYEHKTNRDLVVLFLTDGYPNEETPNQVATSAILRDKYPYMTINGVQYEMGSEIKQDIIDISDNQFYADMETLNNVLFDASIAPVVYENFEIVDYIEDEYFYVNDVNDIKVSIGTVKLEGSKGEKQKITWNLGNNYKTGGTAKMEINLTFKGNLSEEVDRKFYPTNESESFKSKLPDEDEKTKESTLTPVLSNMYEVIYEPNAPKSSECNLKEFNKKILYHPYENVDYATEGEDLTCNGYIFKGWEIDDKETDGRSKTVQRVNDEVFVMPEHDVVVRGTWSKPVISKAMDGTIHENATLYNVIKRESNSGSGFAAEYTAGKADDSYTDPDANEKIYYYQGAVTNNNVLFGGFCWQMVRTTATGGVKMVYNGLPDASGGCNNTGTAQQLSSTSKFNTRYLSPAYVGYMFNQATATAYEYKTQSIGTTIKMLTNNYMSSSSYYNYYYSTSITYDGQYHLGGDAAQQTWSSFYNDAVGYYTCRSTSSTSCSTAYYVAATTSSYQYDVELRNGNLLEQADPGMYIGTSYTENGGTYTVTDTTIVKKRDWYQNYNSYKGMYMCGDGSTTTCSASDFKNFVATENYNATSISMTMKFGSSFTYDGGSYTLTDAKTYFELNSDLSNHHYTCLNDTGTCSAIRYGYYFSSQTLYTIELKDGKSVENALEEMLTAEDVNQEDSTIKAFIDEWYASNIDGQPFEEYIEDTIYCNDRSISNLGGWNPNGGGLTSTLNFSAYSRSSRTTARLTCSNETDKFSVSNSKAQLTYPVGLLSKDEAQLVSGSSSTHFLKTSQYWWLGSPGTFVNNYAREYYVHSSGSLDDGIVDFAYGVRPAVSLRPGTEYSDGNGSADKPYIVDTSGE